jgi:hypothetical protein
LYSVKNSMFGGSLAHIANEWFDMQSAKCQEPVQVCEAVDGHDHRQHCTALVAGVVGLSACDPTATTGTGADTDTNVSNDAPQ